MPLWHLVPPTDGLDVWCDLETGTTFAYWTGGDPLDAIVEWAEGCEPGVADFCGYQWAADGVTSSISNTDYLWWCLDDWIYGAFFLGYIAPNHRLVSGLELTAESTSENGLTGPCFVLPDPLVPWGDYDGCNDAESELKPNPWLLHDPPKLWK